MSNGLFISWGSTNASARAPHSPVYTPSGPTPSLLLAAPTPDHASCSSLLHYTTGYLQYASTDPRWIKLLLSILEWPNMGSCAMSVSTRRRPDRTAAWRGARRAHEVGAERGLQPTAAASSPAAGSTPCACGPPPRPGPTSSAPSSPRPVQKTKLTL